MKRKQLLLSRIYKTPQMTLLVRNVVAVSHLFSNKFPAAYLKLRMINRHSSVIKKIYCCEIAETKAELPGIGPLTRQKSHREASNKSRA